MRSHVKRALLAFVAVFVISDRVFATISVECVPLGGTEVAGGEIVEVECFGTSDIPQLLTGYVLDLPCSLLAIGAATGAIDSIGLTTDPDGLDGLGPSSGGVPFIFPTGQSLIDTNDCLILGVRCGLCPPELIPPDMIRYLGTIRFLVSDCTVGEFTFSPENYSIPPSSMDRTKFAAPGGGGTELIPIEISSFTFLVESGACCMADSTCEVLNATCCESQGGVPQSAGTMCDGDADGDGVDAACGDPCFGFPNVDADDDGFCDSADNCPVLINPDQSDYDNDTVGDACDLCPGQDDLLDADNNFVPDCRQNIPTVSTWGMVVLALSLMTLSKLGGWAKLKCRVDDPTDGRANVE
ncbi:MAG: hypothetical protein AABZ47_04080 [Planctomycetota bacterium]